MSTGVQVNTDVLRQAGGALKGISQQLDQLLTKLENELKSYHGPWGNDDIGQLIQAAYEEVVSFAFDCLRGVVHEILDSSSDLGHMAERYDAMEKDITNWFKKFLEALGSR